MPSAANTVAASGVGDRETDGDGPPVGDALGDGDTVATGAGVVGPVAGVAGSSFLHPAAAAKTSTATTTDRTFICTSLALDGSAWRRV
jgi:hypothetical protein